MGCKHSASADPQKQPNKNQKKKDVQLKKTEPPKVGKQFAMDELSQVFISYENIAFQKFNLLYGAQKSIKYTPQYEIKSQLFLKLTEFKIVTGETALDLSYTLSDISCKGKKIEKETKIRKQQVQADLLIDVTPSEELCLGSFYLIEITNDSPWIRINICLGPTIESLKLLPNAPKSQQVKTLDWISHTTTGDLELKGVSATVGQEFNAKPVQSDKFDFGARYDVHFNDLQGLQHYKKDPEDEDDYAEVGLTMIVINETTGKLIYSQMDIIPEGTELMYEDAKDLSLFISIGSDEFKQMEHNFLWVCYGWDKKKEDQYHQFFSFIKFQIKNECQEVVKILGFEQLEESIKVEIFGKTNWMINQRYYVLVNKSMEAMVKENINQFISLKMIFDKAAQKNQENAIYLIKEGEEIMTQWKIKEMFKFTN